MTRGRGAGEVNEKPTLQKVESWDGGDTRVWAVIVNESVCGYVSLLANRWEAYDSRAATARPGRWVRF